MLFLIKNREVNVKKRHNAFSLLETLIALSLGSLLLYLASHLYSDLYLNQYKHRELFKLQKNAHQILSYLQQQILHTGYQGINRSESNFGWFKYQGKAYHLEKNCLVILQDLNGDGCVGKRARQCVQEDVSNTKEIAKEMTAIKFESNGLLVAGKQNKFTPCYKDECSQWLKSCQNLQWEKIAAVSDNRIEQLQFSWEKPEKLIKIELVLSSLKEQKIQYSATAYAYLLNGE